MLSSVAIFSQPIQHRSVMGNVLKKLFPGVSSPGNQYLAHVFSVAVPLSPHSLKFLSPLPLPAVSRAYPTLSAIHFKVRRKHIVYKTNECVSLICVPRVARHQ